MGLVLYGLKATLVPLHGGSVVVDFCILLLPLWESVIFLCFVVSYFMSILALQSS